MTGEVVVVSEGEVELSFLSELGFQDTVQIPSLRKSWSASYRGQALPLENHYVGTGKRPSLHAFEQATFIRLLRISSLRRVRNLSLSAVASLSGRRAAADFTRPHPRSPTGSRTAG